MRCWGWLFLLHFPLWWLLNVSNTSGCPVLASNPSREAAFCAPWLTVRLWKCCRLIRLRKWAGMRLSEVAAGVVLCKSATGARLGSNHVISWKRLTLCADTKVPGFLLISPTFQHKCKGAIERISVCFVLTVHIIRQSVKDVPWSFFCADRHG